MNNETSADVSVIEGENATLICRATGKPLPRITWRREDGKPIWLRSNAYSTYLFLHVQINSCDTTDSLKNISLSSQSDIYCFTYNAM